MLKDTIIKGKGGNVVEFDFTFTGDFSASGLNTFDRIVLEIGDESYDTDIDSELTIDSDTKLSLAIGMVTALDDGYYTPTITGYSVDYQDGYELNGDCKNALGRKVRVC